MGWDDHKQPGWLEIDLVAHCGVRLEREPAANHTGWSLGVGCNPALMNALMERWCDAPEQLSDLGGEEERDADPQGGGLRALDGHGGG